MDNSSEYEACSSCAGLGVIDIGDCENGVQDVCPDCDGEGYLKIERDI